VYLILILQEASLTILSSDSNGDFEVKFIDDSYSFNQPINPSKPTIILPYRPIKFMKTSTAVKVCRVRWLHESIKPTKEDARFSAASCSCIPKISADSVHLITPPRTIQKPTHEYFLTAQRTPVTSIPF
jgi:hypothetical protein